MSIASDLPYRMDTAPFETTDPGTGVAILVDRWNQFIALDVAAGATETNTLAAPLRAARRVCFTLARLGAGGTRAITAASAINQTGNTIMTFAEASDSIILESVQVGIGGTAVYKWRVVYNDGVALS